MASGERVLGGAYWVVVCAAMSASGGCRGSGDVDESEALSRVSPAAVSIPGAWSLFDRSVESGFVPGSEPIRVALDHVEQISALKVYGAAGYRLRVTGQDGSSIGLPAWDLSALGKGWHVLPTSSMVSTNVVELRFEPIGASGGTLSELELWAIDDQPLTGAVDLTASPDSLPDGFVTLQGGTRTADVLPGDCVTFEVPVRRIPSSLRRVHLVYQAEGLFRSFSLARTINGVAESGGVWLAGDTSARAFVDEIDPSVLNLGSNEIGLCLPADATRGVALTNVHLVGELDRGTALVTAAQIGDATRTGSALVDRKAETTVELSAGERIVFELDRLLAPDALALSGRSLDAENAPRVECVEATGSSVDLKVAMKPTASGLVLKLDAGTRRCSAIAMTVGANATLAGVDIIGSGAGEPVDWPRMIVTSQPEHFGDVAYVGGFMTKPSRMSGAIRVEVAGKLDDAMTGAFGRLLTRQGDTALAWPVSVTTRLPDGTTKAQQLVLDRDARAQRAVKDAAAPPTALQVPTAESKFGREGESIVATTKKLESTKIRLGTSVGVDIPVGALATPTAISLRSIQA